MRRWIGALMLAGLAMAEPVMVTRSGQKYHSEGGTCLVMRGKGVKAKVERATAEGKGLTACKACYRQKAEKKAEKGRNDWAFGGK